MNKRRSIPRRFIDASSYAIQRFKQDGIEVEQATILADRIELKLSTSVQILPEPANDEWAAFDLRHGQSQS